jgi:DNA-binding MurR/RpiR family transcriptional regulator
MTIAKIHNLFKNLTETEQKLASYVLSSPDKVVNMTAKELADACGTVPSAVNRMCKSIGLEGFAKLKLSLAADIGKGNPLDCESALPDEAPQRLCIRRLSCIRKG